MEGKRSRLRAGEAVELEPGVQGRLNFKDRTLELSDGRRLPISEKDQRELFPANENVRKVAEQKERIEREIKEKPFGEFGHQFANKGLIGGAKDWIERLTHTGDEYLRLKQAQHEVGERISEESPFTSGAATVASFVPDFALTKGMSLAKAAPLLIAGSAGSRVLDEPGQVAGEAALGAGIGFGLDKVTNYLGKISSRRAASRALPGQQAEVRAANAAGEAATAQANQAEKQSFNALREKVRNENEALLHQHQLNLTERQNKMIDARNAFDQAKAARDAEVFRLENEYKTARAERSANAERLENDYRRAKAAGEQETKRLNDEYQLAKKQYDESLKELPRLQKEAQAEYSRNVIKNVEDIQKGFPKDARIVGRQIGVQDFIDESINTTGLAGSREGAQASRILKSLFPEGDLLTAKELSKRYQAIEDAIQRATPEVQQVLTQFKNHLGERLPVILEDTIAHSKIMPSLGRNLSKDISKILHEIPFGKGEEATRGLLMKRAESNLNQILRQVGPENFVRKLQSGEIANTLKNGILSTEDFLTDAGFSNYAKLRKEGLLEYATKELNSKHAYFVNEIDKRINNTLARNEIKAMQAGKEARKKLGRNIRKTYGMAEPVQPGMPPVAPEPVGAPAMPEPLPQIARPNLPPPVAPPIEPPMPQKPILGVEPTPPTPRTFSAQPEPTLAPPSNAAESIGDFLEKPLLKGSASNNLLKLGALKYALGSAAVPLEAAAAGVYGGAKLLTSPGAVGNVARLSFKQGGLQAIQAMMQKYPSFNNGVLENPQERRSMTKEIEDDQEIPLEQKALLQSKINRGIPIEQKLH